jgi:ABC-2 type transport system permease protein
VTVLTLRRIWALVYRHLCLFRRSWPRVLELAYWPVLEVLVWIGFSAFAARFEGFAAQAAGAVLGAVLLWEVALRSQMGFCFSFLEEVWSRNLGQLMVAPIRPAEFVAALMTMAALRTMCGVIPAFLLALGLQRLELAGVGWPIAVFVLLMAVAGWGMALAIVGLILRNGLGAESLAWIVLYGLAPLVCVYYPVATLPAALQPLALAIPFTHGFEGLRAAVNDGAVAWDHMAWCAALACVWLGAGAAVFAAQLRAARRLGLLVSIGE